MSREDRGRPPLAPEEERFVRRLAEIYAAPPLSAQRRRRFEARLDERLARGRRRGGLPFLAGAAIAATAAALFFLGSAGRQGRGSGEDAVVIARAAQPDPTEGRPTPEEALLSWASESPADGEAALPDDYQAIASVFLGG